MDSLSATSSAANLDPHAASYGAEQHDIEIDMELESDGGVSVDSVQIITEPIDDADTATAKQLYHQRPVTEHDSSTYSWILPVTPLDYNPKRIKNCNEHNIAKEYQRLCGLICKNWGVSAEDAVPVDLRSRTPYSFALLNALRRLSGTSKEQFDMVQSLLLDAWNRRILRQRVSSDPAVQLIETIDNGGKRAGWGPHCEIMIQENLLGLKIEDVEDAMIPARRKRKLTQEEHKKLSRKAKKLKRLARQEARIDAPRQSIAARVLNRPRAARLAANKSLDLGDALVDIQFGSYMDQDMNTSVPPNSPVAAHDQSRGFAIDSALRELGSRHNQLAGTLDQHGDALYKPSKGDRIQDRQISQVLKNMDMRSSNTMKKRKLKRLEAGGFSRRNHQNVPLPSEKIKLESLPSLHAMSSDELSQIGQLPLPDAPTFSLPLRPTRTDQ